MNHATAFWLVGVGALALSACASAPMHYYTLLAPAAVANGAPEAGSQTASSMPFELLPVSLPAQVDQPQLVVRDGAQGMLLLNGERWIAPLGDELRGALAAELARDLHTRDASGLPANDQPRLRIQLDVRSFDSQLGSYALIAGTWNVRVLNSPRPAAVTCASRLRETVGDGYPALVRGHQQAVAALAAQIAVVARALSAGQSAVCPTT